MCNLCPNIFFQDYSLFPNIRLPLHNKLDRLTNLVKGGHNNFESLEDTFKDLACYAVMNLIEMELKNKIYDACVSVFELELDRDLVMVEMPRDPSLGDYSTNIAMRLTKILRQNPRLIAEKIVEFFPDTTIESL